MPARIVNLATLGLLVLLRSVPSSAGILDDDEPIRTTVITRKVPVPYVVQVERKVPYPIRVPVRRPFAVFVPKPYYVEVPKQVPYAVKVPIPSPFPVEKQVPVPYKVTYDRPYPVQVPKPYPVLFEKHAPTSSPLRLSEASDEVSIKINHPEGMSWSEPDFALPSSTDPKMNAPTLDSDTWTEASSQWRQNSTINYPEIYERGKGMFVSPALTNKIHPHYKLMFDPVKKEYFLEYNPTNRQKAEPSDRPVHQNRFPNNFHNENPSDYREKTPAEEWISQHLSDHKELTLQDVVSKLKFLNSNPQGKETSQRQQIHQHFLKTNYRFRKPVAQAYSVEQDGFHNINNFQSKHRPSETHETESASPGFQHASSSYHPSYFSDPAISQYTRERAESDSERVPLTVQAFSENSGHTPRAEENRLNDTHSLIASDHSNNYYSYSGGFRPIFDRKEIHRENHDSSLTGRPIHVVSPSDSINENFQQHLHSDVPSREDQPHSEALTYHTKIVYVPYPVYTTNESYTTNSEDKYGQTNYPSEKRQDKEHYSAYYVAPSITTTEPPLPHYNYQFNASYETTTPTSFTPNFQSIRHGPTAQIELIAPPNLTEIGATGQTGVGKKGSPRNKGKRERPRNRKISTTSTSMSSTPSSHEDALRDNDAAQNANVYFSTDFLKLSDAKTNEQTTSIKPKNKRRTRA